MKRITVFFLLCLLFLAACQPTPAVDAVKQKDTNLLIEAVKEAVGLDIPKAIRDVTTGGLIGKAAKEAADEDTPAPAADADETPEA